MGSKSSWNGLKLESPGTYQIRVQGEVESEWIDRLGGMSVKVKSSEDQTPVTTLIGHLSDQAALSGILNTLYELHLPLLSVENMDEPPTET